MKFGPRGVCSAAGCEKCSAGTKTGNGEERGSPLQKRSSKFKRVGGWKLQVVGVRPAVWRDGWLTGSGSVRGPSCPPPLAPRRWLNKPDPTKPTSLPELRRASVPQDPVRRTTNLPRISLKCRERQRRITSVRDTGEAAAGAEEEEERRRAATSSERLRAAGETKEKGSRNTCEQRLQLGTARLKTSFPGEGGNKSGGRLFPLRGTSPCLQPGQTWPALPPPSPAGRPLRGSQPPPPPQQPGAKGDWALPRPSQAQPLPGGSSRSRLRRLAQKLLLKRLGTTAPICRGSALAFASHVLASLP